MRRSSAGSLVWAGGRGPRTRTAHRLTKATQTLLRTAAASNAGDSGVEGVQRQAKIAKPSGAIGERTYDVLLYARIPAGLPHAGEFAIDGRAIELLKQAEKMFNVPNSAPPATDVRGAILDHLKNVLAIPRIRPTQIAIRARTVSARAKTNRRRRHLVAQPTVVRLLGCIRIHN